MNFRYRLSQFMYGRYFTYGIDLLTKCIAVVCVILAIVGMLVDIRVSLVLYLIQTALFIYIFYRLFSKNIVKRRQENLVFLRFFNKIKGNLNFQRRKQSEKETHIYKKCPHCSVMLRLPRRSGEHTVCCPRCKNNFKIKVR